MSDRIQVNFFDPAPFGAEINADEVLRKRGLLFYIGNHKGKSYEPSDLIRMAERFTLDNRRIPIQLDHDYSARNTIGYLVALWTEQDGKELWGEMEIRGKDNIEHVRLGLWKSVSVGIEFADNKHAGRPDVRIYEVSITPVPALDRAEIYNKPKGDQKMEDNKNPDVRIQESGNADAVAAVVEMAADVKAKSLQANVELMALKAENEKMKAEHAAMKAEYAKMQAEKQLMEDTAVIDGYVLSGKTTPAMKDAELELYHGLTAEQRKVWDVYKSAMPAFVDTKTHSTAVAKKTQEPDYEAEARVLLSLIPGTVKGDN